ncbi:putative type IV secretion system protein [endosymbiont of Acanthamoeba sp. UWC8]|uniref:VirB8/TrbF family protein n=1 Tax=endosymbiont of Acanthamoeba sp. UWC8 TaxID=86106 RepID=UPI0004D13756|nr:VirB8/TrbF family protein [endosymbiont of Acanthamoeba sp. UWC8]AIF81591.1 putative type IV secretion system protein [endosymbiont of Acanthamoeba sp. UWC8]
MDEAKQIIAKMIDNGEYFNDSKEWYASKYLYSYTQKAYIGIIAIFSVIFTIVIFKTVMIDNIKKLYPFPLYSEDEVKYYSKIIPVSKGSEPVTISVARYFASAYIKSREEYDFKVVNDKEAWKELLRRVRELSSRKIFSDYVDYIDTTTNPDSPIIKYKDSIKRIIQIQNIEFPKNSVNPESAIVYYKAIEQTDKEEKVSFWKTSITFSMSNIENILDNKSEVEFTITKYDNSELKQNN